MLKNLTKLLSVIFIIALIASCSVTDPSDDADLRSSKEIDEQLNLEVSKMMELYTKAVTTNDLSVVAEFEDYLKQFDSKYDANLSAEFKTVKQKTLADVTRSSSNGADLPLTDLPLNVDGAVYLSGGTGDLISSVINYVSPKVYGKYHHGASFDKDKFDGSNLEAACFHTAVLKGAGYETPNQWMRKTNVAVLNPNTAIDPTALNKAQTNLDYYCNPWNIFMAYGFFKGGINVFDLVTKGDNFYWYCTKVVWRIYSQLGIDIDSNTSQVDWTTSGLYSVVKTYYDIVYFWSPSRARSSTANYINSARSTLVIAPEIYHSPSLKKTYEVIREY